MWCVFLLLLSVTSLASAAPRQIPLKSAIQLRLEVGLPTSLKMPELIAGTFYGVTQDQCELNHSGHYLVFLAKVPDLASRLFIVGQSGDLYQVDFRVGTPPDVQVEVLGVQPRPTEAKAQPFTVSAFLRALRLGKTIPTATEVEIPPPAIPDTRLSLGPVQALGVGGLIGLVVPVTNTQTTALALDLRIGLPAQDGEARILLARWSFPPRLTVRAVMADDDLLSPGDTARVYVVLERRP